MYFKGSQGFADEYGCEKKKRSKDFVRSNLEE
jgi:hypothetical protein